MEKLLELIGWIGPANPSIPEKLRFLEGAFLCGFQAGQRASGIDPKSPDFVVDAGIDHSRSGKKVRGWFIRTKDGRSSYLKHEPARRRKKKRITTATSTHLFQSAKAGQ